MITKARGPILHYLRGDGVGGPSGLRAVVSEEERREAACTVQPAQRRSPSPMRVRNDSDLTIAWALDRFITTSETTATRRHHLDSELARINEEWSHSDSFTNVCRGKPVVKASRVSSALAAVALRTAQEEAK